LSIFFEKIEVFDKKVQKVTYAPLFQKLLDAEKVTVSTNWLERWYEFGRIDWVSELEYPEWTTKEVSRFLQY